MNALTELQAIAVEALDALDTGNQIQPFSSRTSSFNLDDAYRVTAAVGKMREARGELPVGRKIGFTNRTAWVDYNVNEPMWGYVMIARYTTSPNSAIRSRSCNLLSHE